MINSNHRPNHLSRGACPREPSAALLHRQLERHRHKALPQVLRDQQVERFLNGPVPFTIEGAEPNLVHPGGKAADRDIQGALIAQVPVDAGGPQVIDDFVAHMVIIASRSYQDEITPEVVADSVGTDRDNRHRRHAICIVQVQHPAENDVRVFHYMLFGLLPLVPDGIEKCATRV